jgi:hypothetical protein
MNALKFFEFGGFRIVVSRRAGGFAARIYRSDGKLFTFRGTKTDGTVTAVKSDVGAAHAEAIRMIERREVF